MWPAVRIALRSFSERPITFDFDAVATLSSSPTVLTSILRGEAPTPTPTMLLSAGPDAGPGEYGPLMEQGGQAAGATEGEGGKVDVAELGDGGGGHGFGRRGTGRGRGGGLGGRSGGRGSGQEQRRQSGGHPMRLYPNGSIGSAPAGVPARPPHGRDLRDGRGGALRAHPIVGGMEQPRPGDAGDRPAARRAASRGSRRCRPRRSRVRAHRRHLGAAGGGGRAVQLAPPPRAGEPLSGGERGHRGGRARRPDSG